MNAYIEKRENINLMKDEKLQTISSVKLNIFFVLSQPYVLDHFHSTTA